MKRLLRIGCSTFVLSFIPIVTWFLLGLTLDANLTNVFSLTYPIQFIWGLLLAIFATGANIKAKKENNKNAVLSGITLGIFIGAIIFLLFLIFVDEYITFMSMEVNVYKNFVIYAILISFIRMVFSFILEKMYFEDREKLANKHSIIFNILNMVVLVVLSLITKNQVIIIVITLCIMAIYVLVLLIKNYSYFKLDFNILTNFKYKSVEIFEYFMLFLTYFFGFSNAFALGADIVALNFVALVTDSQWDCFVAVTTCAEIDICNKEYNFKKTIKHSFVFALGVMASSIVLFFTLFAFYDVGLKIGLLLLSVELAGFLEVPLSYGFEPFVHLEHSATVNTAFGVVKYIIRTFISVSIPFAYCTQIGQLVAMCLSLVYLLYIRLHFYKQNKEGVLLRKKRNNLNRLSD